MVLLTTTTFATEGAGVATQFTEKYQVNAEERCTEAELQSREETA